ncbi:MAG: hypothetical protein K2J06_00665, partial [Muribaculaceae bacterium]|nr:hypothetical protein [Muribaculaceae bacterium]
MKKIVLTTLLAAAALSVPAQIMAQHAQRVSSETASLHSSAVARPMSDPPGRTLKVYEGNPGIRQALGSFVSPLATAKASTPSLASVNLIGSVISSETNPVGMYKISLTDGELTPICTVTDKCPNANRSGFAMDGKYYSAWQFNFFDIQLIIYVDMF